MVLLPSHGFDKGWPNLRYTTLFTTSIPFPANPRAGAFGALNRASGSRRNWIRAREIYADPGHPHLGSKEDYLGRAERITGPGGWARPPWSDRYPRFAAIMSDEGEFGRLWPIGCEVGGNVYAANTRRNATFWDRFEPRARAKSTFTEEYEVELDAFRNIGELDLRPSATAPPEAAAAMHAIPFGAIGLRLDAHRLERPDPAHYRRAIATFYAGIGSMPGTTKQIDTAAVIEDGPTLRRSRVTVDADVSYDFNYARRGPRPATVWYGEDLAIAVEGAGPDTFDSGAMATIVELLTRTMRVFEDLTGVTGLPRNEAYRGRTVVQVPLDNAGAGGLAHHGILGISVGRPFFDRFHARVQGGNLAIDQVWLYEMNRNFFRPRWNDHIDWAMDGEPNNWGFWTVGMNNAAAVFVTDELGVGLEYFGRGRDAFRAMMDDDYAAYTGDPEQTFETGWMSRVMPWRAEDGQTINDLMSGTLLHWSDEFGGAAFLRRMYREIPRTPKLRDRFDVATARDNWYRIVSRAAGRDLRGYFESELRWPISDAAAEEVAAEFK